MLLVSSVVLAVKVAVKLAISGWLELGCTFVRLAWKRSARVVIPELPTLSDATNDTGSLRQMKGSAASRIVGDGFT